MRIEKIQWERIEEYKFPEPMCSCGNKARWILRYDVLEHSLQEYACSDHRDTGQFVCYAGKGYCDVKEIV